jgi:hypothetical protein
MVVENFFLQMKVSKVGASALQISRQPCGPIYVFLLGLVSDLFDIFVEETYSVCVNMFLYILLFV